MTAASPPPIPTADLSNLFNSPPAPPPHRSSPPISPTSSIAGPSRHRASSNPLFLSPGSASGTPQKRPAPAAISNGASRRLFDTSDVADAGRFYDDFDVDIDLADLPDVAPPLNPPNANGESNGDFGYMLDPFAGLRNNAENADEEGAVKKRRVMAKVDANLLTGETGIIKLMKAAKKYKVKGKGREAEDLRELLNVYQFWAHGMFPKGDFAGTMARVETICRSRRMESAMKGYREAFNPPPRSPTPPNLPRSSTNQDSPNHQEGSNLPSPDATDPFVTSTQAGQTATGEREPLFSNVPDGLEEQAPVGADEPDWDELAAMEDMERGAVPARAAETDEFEGLYE